TMESQRESARYPSRLSPKGSGSKEIEPIRSTTIGDSLIEQLRIVCRETEAGEDPMSEACPIRIVDLSMWPAASKSFSHAEPLYDQ
ncbi:MAG: hypothetical protein ACRYGP_13505, partial [Janthinobacterium lividum]